MLKINCELPKCMLEDNNELNEYDFVLFHLYIKDAEYREFFRNQRNRLTILDNSAYEFFIKGEALDLEEYKRVIDELQPDYYILPDVLMKLNETKHNTFEFLSKYKPTNTKSKPIGVLQGNSTEDFLNCMDFYKGQGIDAIAIPFHNSFFVDMSNNEKVESNFKKELGKITLDMRYAIGRVTWIRNWEERLKEFNHIHILGSHCPFEKVYYRDFQTMDTGYPVKCGIAGYELFEEPKKPNVIIDDFMNTDLLEKTKSLIRGNIQKFTWI